MAAQDAAGDDYAQGVNNGMATLSLANEALQFGRPLADALLKARADRKLTAEVRRELQKYLGLWYAALTDDDKLERQPVIKLDAFRAYMEIHDGLFEPAGYCQGKAPWVEFVGPDTRVCYIYEGKKVDETVVSYRNLNLTHDNSLKNAISLEMPGEIVCHVMNMFADTPYGQLLRGQVARTDFGTLSLSATADKTIYTLHFAPSDRDSLAKVRQPFGTPGKLMKEEGTRITLYLETNHGNFGVSDGTLGWLQPAGTLQARLQRLNDNLARLKGWKQYHDAVFYAAKKKFWDAKRAWVVAGENVAAPVSPKEPTESKALLVSERWLSYASRIARRATTNGGRDRMFFDDVGESVQEARRAYRCSEADANRIQNSVRCTMMTEHGSYILVPKKELVYNGHDPSPAMGYAMLTPEMAVRRTIAKYANSTNEWKKALFATKDEMEALFEFGHTIEYDTKFVRVIPASTSPGSELWESTALLR